MKELKLEYDDDNKCFSLTCDGDYIASSGCDQNFSLHIDRNRGEKHPRIVVMFEGDDIDPGPVTVCGISYDGNDFIYKSLFTDEWLDKFRED